MDKRLALVVDDSRTARETLKRMLEKHNLDADTVDSAQAALDYLKDHTPDVIFMDHMMPGMDGFQAVEAIKGNPDTATIPIMMYTSKEGDLYVSQARALGAVGILPKQVEHAELFEVLNKLGLVRERRSKPVGSKRSVLIDPPQELALSATREKISEIADQAARSAQSHHSLPGQVVEAVERYHRDILENLHELRDSIRLTEPVARTPAGSPRWLPVLAAVILFIVLLLVYRQGDDTHTSLQALNQHYQQLLAQQRQALTASAAGADTSEQPAQRHNNRERANNAEIYDSLAWAVNLGGSYDPYQEAFGDARLPMVQELVSRLHALGFQGVVQLESHLGEFCLDSGDSLVLAPPDSAASSCDLIGHPQQDLPNVGERQSIAFANFLTSSPLLNRSGIRIEIVPFHFSRPRISYPPQQAGITAQEWNRIAAANNRIEVRLLPDTE